MDYEKLLDKGYKNLPEKTLNRDRFEMPFIESFRQGTRTIVKDFVPIIKGLNREPSIAMKYITKQTGTPGQLDDNRLLLKGKFSVDDIQKLVNEYITRYVLCDECKRPDTTIVDQHGIKTLKCDACGAQTPLRK